MDAKVWLITACSGGFGHALAAAVLASGQRVAATARDPATLADLAARYPETCRTFPLDVTDAGQVTQAVADATQAFGRLDVVVNLAGCGLLGALEECSEEEVRRSFETNFFGPLRVIRAVLPGLRAQRSGHLINFSAAAAISNYAGFASYGAAKSALEMASEALALELQPLGIAVTIVQPGPFRTGFVSRSLQRAAMQLADYDATRGQFATLLEKTDGRQPGDPQRAAEAILQVAAAPKPPLRLVLGRYAQDKVKKKCAALSAELEEWKAIGSATSFQ